MHEDNIASICALNSQSDHEHDTSKQSLPLSKRRRSIMSSSASQLRAAILEYLKDLETRLSQLDPYLTKLWEESDDDNGHTNDGSGKPMSRVRLRRRGSLSATAIQETRAKVQHVLDMLRNIRLDVHSCLPEMPSLDGVRSHITYGIPSFQELDIHLLSKETPEKIMLDKTSVSYLPTLKARLDSLHEHIHSLKLPSSFSKKFPSFTILPTSGIVSDLIYKLQDPNIFTDPLKTPLDVIGTLGETRPSPTEVIKLERQFDLEVQRALKESDDGKRLITWEFIPQKYRYNRYVRSRYRFVPLSAWPRLLLSLFQFHNESANIYTHLIPLLYSLRALWISLPPFPHFFQSVATNLSAAESAEDIIDAFDTPRHAFVLAANFCLLSSCIWHIMAGCSDRKATEIAAKLDYIGIGWLISISSLTFVYYGFACQPMTAYVYIILAICQGVAASILPFKDWFNNAANKNGRIAFFVSLSIGNLVPLTHLTLIHPIHDIYHYFIPTIRSLLSYAIGLFFYTYNIPERYVSKKWRWCTDLFGGGSHAIWHVCIVFAIHFYAQAMVHYRNGVGNEPSCELTWNW